MIVVEGPDGSGKTTLIKELSKSLKLPVAPRVVSKDAEAMVDLVEWVKTNVGGGFKPLIFDRHRLISEFIYGPILRDDQSPGFISTNWVAEMLFKFYTCNPIIIYCLPPVEVVEQNVKADPDNQVVWGKSRALYTAYNQRAIMDMIWYPMRTFIYDYTSESSAELIVSVNSLLVKERQRNVRHPHQ